MDLTHLSQLAARYARLSGNDAARLPGLSVYRRFAVSDIEAVVYDPVLCLILQGGKTTGTGRHEVALGPGDALLVSHDLPVVSKITEASAEAPYTAVILSLDLGIVRGLYAELADLPVQIAEASPLSAGMVDPAWLQPLLRYMELAASPVDAAVLGPSILREIHYRLLLSPLGGMLRRLVVGDSHASRIADAIHIIRGAYRAPLSVPELARRSGMSASSFHAHFKSVTGTTPLQYQKDLRLIEARSLLTEARRSVSDAAYAVGYESPTHFSRDYSRKFGVTPSLDARLVAVAGGAGPA